MAITRENKATKLTVVVNTGTQAEPAYKNRIFGNINPVTTDTLAYTVCGLLGGLQAHTVDKFTRTDTATLVSDE